MTEKILILGFSFLFLITFIQRNASVQKQTGRPVRGRSLLVRTSIGLTTLLFAVTILSVFSPRLRRLFGPIPVLTHPRLAAVGYVLFAAAIGLCVIASRQLRDSWRVGVIEADKTELIRTGLYARIRNPYFDGYFLMFLAFIMIRPAVVNLLLAAGAATSFHIMVLREERHLLRVHGQSYLHYKISTGRYAPRGKKR